MVLIRDQRTVYINRNLPSKCLIQTVVFRCRGKIFISADNVCDSHQMVIDHVRKIVSRESIGFDQDHIIQFCIRNRDISVNLIVECGCSLIRYVQTDHPRFSCCQIGLYLFFAQPQTVLVIHNDICSVFRNRSLQGIQACFITEAVIRVALLYQLLCILQIHSGSISLALHIRTISTILVRSFIVNETCLFQSTVNDVQCSFHESLLVCIFNSEDKVSTLVFCDQICI